MSTGDMKTGAKDQTRKRKMAANPPAAKKGKVVANPSSPTKKSKVVSYSKKRKMTPSHSTLSTGKRKGPGIRKRRELGLLSLLTSTIGLSYRACDERRLVSSCLCSAPHQQPTICALALECPPPR